MGRPICSVLRINVQIFLVLNCNDASKPETNEKGGGEVFKFIGEASMEGNLLVW